MALYIALVVYTIIAVLIIPYFNLSSEIVGGIVGILMGVTCVILAIITEHVITYIL